MGAKELQCWKDLGRTAKALRTSASCLLMIRLITGFTKAELGSVRLYYWHTSTVRSNCVYIHSHFLRTRSHHIPASILSQFEVCPLGLCQQTIGESYPQSPKMSISILRRFVTGQHSLSSICLTPHHSYL